MKYGILSIPIITVAMLVLIVSLNSLSDNAFATTTATSNNRTTTSIGVISSPFYESNISKVISERVVNTANGTPQIEVSTLENATIKGVGNVTNLQTWNNIYKSPTISYGGGQGVITTADGQDKATWTGYGVGRINTNGVTIYHDFIFFNTSSTGKLSFLNNMVGLRTDEVEGNKDTAKISEWRSK